MAARRDLRKTISAAAAALMAFGAVAQSAQACTGILLGATDGSYVHARTLEFGVDPESEVIIVPRGFARTGTAPDGAEGLKWTAKYASVGANGLSLPILLDGVNEAGLAAGLFYLPGYAGYMPTTAADTDKAIAPWELASWALDNFATVDEVRAGLDEIVVPAVVLAAWGFVPPMHLVVRDAAGNSIVIEYIDGKLNVHDAPLGVITNSPGFDWHMTNLRNYVNFSLTNVPAVKLGSVTLEPFGQGSGMLGIPGDFTPPSRFVRAVAFTQSVFPSQTGGDAVLSAFHILNNFDIPKGSVRTEKDEHGNVEADYTIWTSASDLKTKRFYFRTHENSRIRMVDLTAADLDASDIVKIPMKGPEVIENLTP